jgi:hypothetical protein
MAASWLSAGAHTRFTARVPRAQNFSKMAAQFQGLQFYQVKVQSSMGQQQMMIMMKAQQVRERGEGIEHHKNRLRFPYVSTFFDPIISPSHQ